MWFYVVIIVLSGIGTVVGHMLGVLAAKVEIKWKERKGRENGSRN